MIKSIKGKGLTLFLPKVRNNSLTTLKMHTHICYLGSEGTVNHFNYDFSFDKKPKRKEKIITRYLIKKGLQSSMQEAYKTPKFKQFFSF